MKSKLFKVQSTSTLAIYQSQHRHLSLQFQCTNIAVVPLGCVQTDARTPNIVAPTMLGVVACVLAVVCKRMQQLPTMLEPAVHRGKDTTHKSL